MTRASLAPIGIPIAFLLALQALVLVWHSGAATPGGPPGATCDRPDFVIIFSDPPDGFVDPRAAEDALGRPMGITTVQVTFDAPIVLDPSCVSVISSGGRAPSVAGVRGSRNTWDIELEHPIPVGEATTIEFFGGATSVTLHAHPGDVNLDGLTDQTDVATLQAVVGSATTSAAALDMNRDGTVDNADVDLLTDMVDSGSALD